MTAPLIGITTRGIPAEQLGETPAGLRHMVLEGVFTEYPEAVTAAGAIPVLLTRETPIEGLMPHLDGLLLSGGEDVLPDLYGGRHGPHDTRHDPKRDAFELSLVRSALTWGMPILAICRGCQLLNVALGGTLVSHLEESDGFSHSATTEHRTTRRHTVTIHAESRLVEALQSDLDEHGAVLVNSFHHQAIEKPGTGLRVVGHAHDGTIEAIEMPGRPVFGVQWHPEMHEGTDPIFPWFVRLVREHRDSSHLHGKVASA